MENLEKWLKDNNISMSSIGKLLNLSKGSLSYVGKGDRALNKKEMEKVKILDEYAAKFQTKQMTKSNPIIVEDPKLSLKLERDMVKLGKLVIELEKLNAKIDPLAKYLQYLSSMQDESIIANTLGYEIAYKSTKENLEELLLKRQYLLIEKAAVSGAIAVNKRYNITPK